MARNDRKRGGVEEHLSLADAAERMGISERTARRWIKSGKLRAYKPGRDYWIPESALTELVEESKVNPKAPASSQPSFNGLLEEERRPAFLARGVAAAADKWDATVSNPDASPHEVSAAVDAALGLGEALAGEALAGQLGEPPALGYSPNPWDVFGMALRLLEISKVGNERVKDGVQEELYTSRREQMRELTRRISA
jgi:excisionase family DNA binding protein